MRGAIFCSGVAGDHLHQEGRSVTRRVARGTGSARGSRGGARGRRNAARGLVCHRRGRVRGRISPLKTLSALSRPRSFAPDSAAADRAAPCWVASSMKNASGLQPSRKSVTVGFLAVSAVLAAIMAAPRSTMDRDGVMRWRCSQCSVFRPESEMVWGLGGGREEWPPWRVVCTRCSAALPKLSTPPAAKHSPQRSQLSPRRTLSPRRLVPLATARADLNARSACTGAAASGGSLAAASILRPPAPRRSRDPQRHALVSRFRDDGLHARPKPLAAPGVNSRLQALSTAQHSILCRSDAEEDEDEPPPGGFHPQIFFEPKLERSMLRGLLAQTTMSRTELYRLFNRFKALCQVRCRAAALPRCQPASTKLPPSRLASPLSPLSLPPPPAPCTLPSPPGGGVAVERDTRLDRQEDLQGGCLLARLRGRCLRTHTPRTRHAHAMRMQHGTRMQGLSVGGSVWHG